MSILLSLNSSSSNFIVLQSAEAGNGVSSQGKRWFVKKNSLLAWSGNYLKINETEKFNKMLKLSGNGKFVLTSPGSIVQIDLKENEKILVNPLSVIAYSSPNETMQSTKTESEGESQDTDEVVDPSVKYFVDLSIPKVSTMTRFSFYFSKITSFVKSKLKENQIELSLTGKASTSTSSTTTPTTTTNQDTQQQLSNVVISITSAITKFTRFIRLSIGRLITGSKTDYMVEFKGPKTLLIHNNLKLKDSLLTDKEIEQLSR
ncbi:unnamed protein product [Ambrosiozyma monospora]|uniref:Altered inheritance of mitochondria protein 24, mitochondrial n=1 Tax=Ambrosiozyma monospora TaxID=43982 RepID=A0A9W6Z2I1_AMBMO|nr:unnamed protein product [Ambrosiozyma monospora]